MDIRYSFLEDVTPGSLIRALREVGDLYPGFEYWLVAKFIRNMSTGERKLLIAHNDDDVMGYSLLKQNALESKICTFLIRAPFRGLNVGSGLMDESLRTLDSSDTFITVSEERMDELAPLLKAKGFVLKESIEGRYRPGAIEHTWSL